MSRDLDSDVQALSYLASVIIHRLHESDRAWWEEFREEIRQARTVATVGSVKDKVLERALGILDESMRGDDGE